jgi:hypothetical protein
MNQFLKSKESLPWWLMLLLQVIEAILTNMSYS